jgi:hypothetical protein
MSREDMYGLLDSYLFPSEVDEYLAHIKLHKRKTA